MATIPYVPGADPAYLKKIYGVDPPGALEFSQQKGPSWMAPPGGPPGSLLPTTMADHEQQAVLSSLGAPGSAKPPVGPPAPAAPVGPPAPPAPQRVNEERLYSASDKILNKIDRMLDEEKVDYVKVYEDLIASKPEVAPSKPLTKKQKGLFLLEFGLNMMMLGDRASEMSGLGMAATAASSALTGHRERTAQEEEAEHMRALEQRDYGTQEALRRIQLARQGREEQTGRMGMALEALGTAAEIRSAERPRASDVLPVSGGLLDVGSGKILTDEQGKPHTPGQAFPGMGHPSVRQWTYEKAIELGMDQQKAYEMSLGGWSEDRLGQEVSMLLLKAESIRVPRSDGSGWTYREWTRMTPKQKDFAYSQYMDIFRRASPRQEMRE